MALVRNGLSMKMKGRAGSFSFYSSKGRQVVRVAQNSTNYGESARRSEAQQMRRVRWANLVNAYKMMSGTLHGAFETKRSNETDYNAFMRKNLPIASVALTKDQAAMGCYVPQAFVVSEGSLFSPGIRFSDEHWVTGIKFRKDAEAATMKVKEFSEGVISNNFWAHNGVQLSLLVISPGELSDTPKPTFTRYELTLDTSDERNIAGMEVWESLVTDVNGFLQFMTLSADAYVALVISDSTTGQLKVSNSSYVQGDTDLEEYFSADAQVAKAIESYGVDASRFLESGDL